MGNRHDINPHARQRSVDTDAALAREIAEFIIGHGRNEDGWDTTLYEIAARFPDAPLRVFAQAARRVSS
jgi:hypothetical protein